jgi:TonB family protein
MYWKSIQVLLLAATSVLAHAPASGAQVLQGILVSGKDHRPVGSARLQLVDDSGHVVARDVADSASGAFALLAPRAGSYEVKIVVGHGGVSFSPPFALDSAQVLERAFAVPDWPRPVLEAYLAEDITRPAAYKPGTGFRGPRYPDGLRASGHTGVVRARFVVDRKGRADMSTFQVLESDDDLFTRSVRDAAAHCEFVPAELNGLPVPQVFEMDVEFRFANTPLRLHGNNVITITATPRS